MSEELLAITADIVAAHVSNNTVATSDVATLIQSVFKTLTEVTSEPAAPEAREPAVPVRSSVKPDYIVCLEDGAKLKMLKRYIATKFSMTPDQYRAKWNLPRDYPMVAPNYAEQRKELALKIGLGRKRSAATDSAPTEAPAAGDVAKSTRKPRAAKAAPSA